ncbi:ATP-dependent Lhr-like helicase [Kocuria rhizophila]|uniref:Lhr family ATP-dependent helicase n=1 Tax=Kocuria rhizophila TaxID=72000 RepID=UPI00285C4727|nr:DEAD/DEAH box helicase [Kocuria rhizophila]MDR7373240.1 ATP-dependent Lhr-like helicase [Kocuria rhizophila]
MDPDSVLNLFSPATAQWFDAAFHGPTAAQRGAWEAISAGHHALVVAPTGSGKTLAAFLWSIDRLLAAKSPAGSPDGSSRGGTAAPGSSGDDDAAAAPAEDRTSVLYISPLKALGVDVERNLRAPLIGITQAAKAAGGEPPEISVGVRSGDTPQAIRRALLAHPPDILITTPESLYLMLTSKARETLRHVNTVIIDEVHAVAGTKRGAHLAVSLERLDDLLEEPAQRIGLSATVEPVDTVAGFLGGSQPVDVVRPPSEKDWDLTVSVPIPDMTVLGGAAASPSSDGSPNLDGDLGGSGQATASIWPHVEERIVDLVEAHRSTIVFANSRGLAEKLTARLNEIHEFRMENAAEQSPVGERSGDPVAVGDALNHLFAESARRAAGEEGAGPEGPNGFAVEGDDTPGTPGAPSDGPGRHGRAPDHAAPFGAPGDGTGAPDGPGGVARPATDDREPAAIPRQSNRHEGASPVLARAHHGSVSKDQRSLIEEDLKTGRLRCVVATSSLELGIDMGHVDLVVQIESPPSAASGLQRVGRAGHQVGEVSIGRIYPKHRGDVRDAAVIAEQMLAGNLEPLSVPANPLDILAQQTVSAVAAEDVDVEAWYDTVRRSAPFRSLPRSAYDAVLDLLAGRYPSDEFAQLRPRLVWDRETGTLQARPGALRLATTSGGTIPDRGLFPVFLVGEQDSKSPKRVGELDEEMVYESRVGDIIALGASSWRIEEITHNRVVVAPAPGVPGKLPFWHGDGLGRPVELGRAVGRFTRELAGAANAEARERLAVSGLDEWAQDNLLAYLAEQREATEHVPDDRTLMVERFRDELGDWRVVLHSPFGTPVHGPWALAVRARLDERWGLDASAQAADDGIVLRVPATDEEPPGAELFLFEPEELEQIVTEEVGGSALFASRFRENAARALLLPRADPGKRTPLWQQRQRSAQLLDVARKYPQFPIILETVRECLQDVYDVPALLQLQRDLAGRKLRVVETTTDSPSPFARTLLFGYVAQFLYEGDSPLAERKAAALSLDPALLNELLGRAELRELLDPEVIETTVLQLQRLAPDRRLRGVEGAADLLRLLGPMTADDAALRLRGDGSVPAGSPAVGSASAGSNGPGAGAAEPDAPAADAEASGAASSAVPEAASTAVSALIGDEGGPGDAAASGGPDDEETERAEDPAYRAISPDAARELLDTLVDTNRAIVLRVGGREVYCAVEDAARMRDALGQPLPMGVPLAFLEPVADPVGDLVSRYARTHGPFSVAEAAQALSLGPAVVESALRSLGKQRRVSEGAFRPSGDPAASDSEWCDIEVLRTLRRRSLAALRADVEPVDPQAYATFLPAWQHAVKGHQLRGLDGVLTVIDQLAGVPIPASAWEPLVLAQRVVDYRPAMLDELMATGEVVFSGAGSLGGEDGWVAFHLAESAELSLPPVAQLDAAADALDSALERELLTVLQGGGAYFAWQLVQPLAAAGVSVDMAQLRTALWNLLWAGLITNDTYAPVRALISGGHSAHKTPKRPGRSRSAGRRGAARLRAVGRGPAGFDPAGSADDAAPSGTRVVRASGGGEERTTAGRWSVLRPEPLNPTVRAQAQAELLLDRYGILTRGPVAVEDVPGGFSTVYKVLRALEDAGRARRGYFIEGLGAAQFTQPATVDVLRSFTDDDAVRKAEPQVLALAATDPANPYGAALDWPEAVVLESSTKHRPGRKAGAVVVLVDGALTLYLERGGKTALAFVSDPALLHLAAEAVAGLVQRKAVDSLVVEKVNGDSVLSSEELVTAVRDGLLAGGFYQTPKGVRMRAPVGGGRG